MKLRRFWLAILLCSSLPLLTGCDRDCCCDFCRACVDCSNGTNAAIYIAPPAVVTPEIKPAPPVVRIPAPIYRPAPRHIEVAPTRSVVYASQNETNIRD